MSTNPYQEMRNRQQAEVNAFPMFLPSVTNNLRKGCTSLV